MPAVTLRSLVELGLVSQGDLAVLMAKNKAGGRDPYDPAVVVEAKSDKQLPFDIWSFNGASTLRKSKYMDLVWFSRDEVTGKLICHLSGLAKMVFLVDRGAGALAEVFIQHIEEINELQKDLCITEPLHITLH